MLDEPSASLSAREVDAPVDGRAPAARPRARHHLHLASVRRDLRHRRSRDGAARRPPRRDRGGGRPRSLAAHPMDGRPRRVRGISGARRRRQARRCSRCAASRRPPRFRDVSFTVRAGEIVGLAGLVGAGRTSAALAIVGALASRRRRARSTGERVRLRTPADAIDRGLAYLTEDRKARGIFAELSTSTNITMTFLARVRAAGFCSGTRERDGRHAGGARLRRPRGQPRAAGRHAVGRQPAEDAAGALSARAADAS